MVEELLDLALESSPAAIAAAFGSASAALSTVPVGARGE